MVPVIAIVGRSGVGKTVIMEKLIAEFKSRGYRVGAVKHSHQTIDLDAQGKDTWRYSEAGSDAVAISSPLRVTVFNKLDHEPALEETVRLLGDSYDIILAEGFKDTSTPKIEVCPSGKPGDLVCNASDLCAVIAKVKRAGEKPVFGRQEITRIADFIEHDVIADMAADMSVAVNGKNVPLKRFVKDIMASSILAMLGTLKRVGIIKTASIHIRRSG
ncbi:MAG: molybdopterin-guanine dinucleotide biosynthesis protein B [Dehalococcoidia bacterium]|jgi:molybdopterin-guanine dinucleotide biosynthesis protein B